MRLALVLLLVPAALAAQVPPYRDAGLPPAARARDLLARMTLHEKFWQLYMIPGDLSDPSHDYSRGIFGLQIAPDSGTPSARAHAERINAIQRHFVERTRLGVPIMPFEEALHGLARPGATTFPQAIALAATWDTSLMSRVAGAIARETRSRGIRQVLSPVVNVTRDVRWGRTEETYGEDPLVNTLMGLAFVRAFEARGIVATPKHFVANVGEGGRDSYPVEVSEAQLDEVWFPPFRAAIREGGARSVMTAYNSVNGLPATQNPFLLSEVLRRRWGFGGFVISDAAATGGATVLHHTEPDTPAAAGHAWEAGLDVVFQSSWPQHRPYLEALERGLVAQAVVDSAVARVLRAKFELGLFERPYADPDSAAHWNGHAAHRALAREAAQASLVLLRNEGVLPLSTSIQTLAVIGTDAVEARLGGYSGPGIRPVSLLAGLRAALDPRATVRFAPGPGRLPSRPATIPAAAFAGGLRGEYSDGTRLEPVVVRTDPTVDFNWTFTPPAPGLSTDWYAVRWTGQVTIPPGPARRIGVEANDGWRLWIDSVVVLDQWPKESYRTRLATAALEPGRTYHLRLDFRETTGNARVRLVWEVPDSSEALIQAAVTAARGAEAAIVVVGIEEGEFRDRASLALPGRQAELIRRVAATGTPVVVVLVGGSAITMSDWIDQAKGVVMAWYPGEAGGEAVADVLFGRANPSGRLPITFPMAEGQLPLYYNHKPTGRADDYQDLTGRPLFPFGFGLSYTAFEYSDLAVSPAVIGPADTATVRVRVRNAGRRAGHEVVQLYLRDLLASVAQPVMALKGFERIALAPGETREVTFRLGPDHLQLRDREGRWVVEPGRFRIMVGASSRDVRQRGFLDVRGTR